MKIFSISKSEQFGQMLKKVLKGKYQVESLENEAGLFEHDYDKCMLVIDIDTLQDHGFTLAAKLSAIPDRKALIVGITTFEVDSVDAKFDFFFSSLNSIDENLDLILERYEQI
ncbi:MAG: hypothetical protein H6622_16125 [Halobacteriovoraceae bacterium]|nr:hypothetical protein [Halobacteriovoraceae bacterium]